MVQNFQDSVDRGMRVAQPITLVSAMRNRLTRCSQALNISPNLRVRSRIFLLAFEWLTNKEISGQLGIDQVQVGRWRKRFAEQVESWIRIQTEKLNLGFLDTRIEPLLYHDRDKTWRFTPDLSLRG